MVHFGADNDISQDSRKILLTKTNNDMYAQKCNLDSPRMLKSFDGGQHPSFKETTFMIRESICFVEKLDYILLSQLNLLEYLKTMMHLNLKNDEKLFENIFRIQGDNRKRKVIQYIKCLGFSELNIMNDEENEYINNLCTMSFREVKKILID